MRTLKTIVTISVISVFFSCLTKQKISSELTYKMRIKVDSSQNITPVCFFEINLEQDQHLYEGDWKIYFNSFKKPAIAPTDSMNFGMVHVNGDIHYIYPKAQFKNKKKGNLLTIPIAQAYLKNVSDFPVGFYLVEGKSAEKYIRMINSDPLYEQTLLPENKLAEEIYEANQRLSQVDSSKLTPILPTPKYAKVTQDSFILDKNTLIIADNNYQQSARFLAKEILKHTGLELEISNNFQKKGIQLKNWNLKDESYQLNIRDTGIEINAGSLSGMFYGIQSLKSLILYNVKDKKAILRGMEIEDEPRFSHRALMVDVARTFQSKEKLLNVIDKMSDYKINILHLHFNDDEGWRIEIDGLPELTKFSGRRGHQGPDSTYLPPSHGSGPEIDSKLGSGYYTKKDFIEILKYANERHVKVVPEIETPGHARAAIKAMEYRYHQYKDKDLKKAEEFLLSDLRDQSKYRTVQGWNDDAINAAMPSSYNFINKVVAELVNMYKEAGVPLTSIHMGGDEVPAGVWEDSKVVKDFIAKNPDVQKPDDLWVYFYSQVNLILKKYNIKMSGWEEIGMKRIDVNGKKKMEIVPELNKNEYLLDVWNNIYGTGSEDLAYRLANQGFKVVLSNVTHMYFDLASNRSFYEPGMFWGGYINVEKPYYFTPENYYKTFLFDDTDHPINPGAFNNKVKLTEQGMKNIVGLQCAIWGETLIAPENFDHMVYPKLIGFAERAWAPQTKWAKITDPALFKAQYNREWNYFTNVLNSELRKFDKYYPEINYRISSPGIKIENGTLIVNTDRRDLEVYYTSNDDTPTIKHDKYTKPITEKGVYKFKAFNPASGRSSKMIIVKFD
jgi:hexosaminidase